MSRIDDGVERVYEVLDDMYAVQVETQRGITLLGALTLEAVECLGDIAGELQDVNRSLNNIEILSREGNRLKVRLLDETQVQGELHREEQRRQGALVRAQMGEMAEFIVDRHERSSSKSIQAFQELARQKEEADERRKNEIVAAMPSFEHAANQKYAHAVTQFDTGNYAQCVKDLDAVFKKKSTHARGWILYGLCAFVCGLPAMAKAAFRNAADYALHDGLMGLYVEAMLRFARLERLVHNHAQGLLILKEAIEAVGQDSPFYVTLCYEEVQALFANPKRTESLEEIADALRDVLIMDPKLREEVATSKLWAPVVAVDPCLRYGNAPFIRLMEIWMDL
ncbi:MAG: hypothetical protein AAB393_13070, partial [Bacteroidota bacterium]